VETDCSDGVDNDGDALIDCLDPDCTHKSCDGSTPAAVCCGTGSNAAVCKDLASDSNNCGGCGLACKSGGCQATSASGVPSGRCGCGAPPKCPMSQSCSGSICGCGSAADCASGEQCSQSVCRYP
jgi:hypothetical protein